jgi:hypothetical protein
MGHPSRNVTTFLRTSFPNDTFLMAIHRKIMYINLCERRCVCGKEFKLIQILPLFEYISHVKLSVKIEQLSTQHRLSVDTTTLL